MKFPRHAIPTPLEFAGFCLMVVMALAFWPQRADAGHSQQQAFQRKSDADSAKNQATNARADNFQAYIFVQEDISTTQDDFDAKKASMSQADKTAVQNYLDSASAKAEDSYISWTASGVQFNDANSWYNSGIDALNMGQWESAWSDFDTSIPKFNDAKSTANQGWGYAYDGGVSITYARTILANYP